MPEKPARVCFNFTHRCNMHCPYCYIPFGEKKADLRVWQRIVDRVVSWNVEAITFGGGDPFMYPKFRDLLLYCRGKVFVHVDTNGLFIKESDFELLSQNVDLLGLPLDGSNSTIHGIMRDDSSHFNSVVNNIERANRRGLRVKINTVVSAKNIDDLQALACLIQNYNIERWSLYEFWPLGDFGFKNRDEYAISADRFRDETRIIKSVCNFTRVEIGTIGNRHRTYFFVTHGGNAYSVDPVDPTRYIQLGSIFDDAVLVRWSGVASPAQNAQRLHARTLAHAGGLVPLNPKTDFSP